MIRELNKKEDKSTSNSPLSNWLETLIQKSFYSITTNVCMTAVFILSAIIPTRINNIDPRNLTMFPDYLLVHALDHYLPQLMVCHVVMMYYYKTPQLRDFYKREWLDFFDSLKRKWGVQIGLASSFFVVLACLLPAQNGLNQHCQASVHCSKQCHHLTSAGSKLSLKIFLVMLGFELGAAGWDGL